MRKLFALIAAAALVAAFTLPAAAAEWNFFGDVKFRTFWADDDSETVFVGGDRGQTYFGPGVTHFDDGDLAWGHSVGTAFGGSVQAGDVGGFVAFRPLENSIHQNGGDFFQVYGTWNFGAGTLLVGKTFGPVNWFGSNMVFLDENCCLGFGGILSYVKPMIQVSFEGDWGLLKIAALQPEPPEQIFPIGGVPMFQQNASFGPVNLFTNAGNTGIGYTAWSVDSDATLPKMEASYTNTWGPLELTLLGGWQSYEAVVYVNNNTQKELDIDSWIIGLGAKLNFGPFYINGDIFSGQNLGQYEFTFQLGSDDAVYRWDNNGGTIIDNDTFGFMIAAGYKVNDMLSFEAGYGYTEHELDWAGNWEDDTQGYYLQAVITLAKGVSITPEIGVLDWKDTSIYGLNPGVRDTDQGKTTWYGAQWRITF
jgi:hypothetical protein